MIDSLLFRLGFVLVATAFSLFYGFRATNIFDVKLAGTSRSWRFHQWWLNFLGSVSGWIASWFLLHKILSASHSPATVSIQPSDIGLFFLAFVGVTGFLPFSVVSVLQGLRDIATKIAGLGK
jgi:hypothetical protein